MTDPTAAVSANAPPDVTVVIPVFNTMPYLRQCLDSVLTQSIGVEQLQVVAVDDGSTDGSGDLIDATAAAYPGAFTAVHQANSGGPASPCNRGLALATGRWVFFLGADDFLGRDALARLVEMGDTWDSDVIFGTMRGENGRFVDQRMYRRTRSDVTFLNSPLAYALSNTKLFRRSLLVDHSIRFALDLRVGSDQPFAVEALSRARRVSVLTDQVYYYAVKREDASNISYSTDWRTRLADIADVMHHIAEVVEPGPVRDAIYSRHFTWEISKLLRRDLPELPDADQHELLSEVAKVYRRYDTPGLGQRLGPRTRLRLRLAQTHQIDLLLRVLAYQADHRKPPLVLRDGRAFVWSPGFGSGLVPDDWYRVASDQLGTRVLGAVKLACIGLAEDQVRLTGSLGLTADSAAQTSVALEPLPTGGRPELSRSVDLATPLPGNEWPVRVTEKVAGEHPELTVVIPLATTLPPQGAQSHSVRWRFTIGGARYDAPARWRGLSVRRVFYRRLSGWSVTLRADDRDFLVLVVERLPWLLALRARVDRLRRGRVDVVEAVGS